MGDHRANIKIEMEFHGVKNSCDMWINYSPRDYDCDGVDYRVVAFFRRVYEQGMENYNTEQKKYYAEQNKKEIEKKEKAELERLKQKYEN